ncbi:MAG TPA: hypothetical protein DEB09_04010 [Candidatus Magasanikbacteria bacterium]|nr:hypothetical protein [Candidatus Magasanikbacteria bacterium]
MNKKLLIILAVIVSTLTIGAGCAKQKIINLTNLPLVASSTVTTYYTYNQPVDGISYCDGANMDSGGYKAALVKYITLTLPGNLTTEERIKSVLDVAADNEQFNRVYTRTVSTTFENGIITMHSADGWAGSSIFYCRWKPFVEKNLEQFSEVKKIEWGKEFESEKAMGYIKYIYEKDKKNYLSIDYIQWLNKSECMAKNIEAPGGFCILNQTKDIRTFEISKNVEIRMQTLSHTVDGNYNWNEEINYQKFKNIFTSSSSQKNIPYNIGIENNKVVEITEQYVP